jgi:hypothetical protein
LVTATESSKVVSATGTLGCPLMVMR